MAGKQAKILSDQQTRSLLVFASTSRNPRRNRLILLLSLKAGLRAGEIAKLTWEMVVGPTGEIGHVIELRDCAAKKKSGRRIPIHPTLRNDVPGHGADNARIVPIAAQAWIGRMAIGQQRSSRL